MEDTAATTGTGAFLPFGSSSLIVSAVGSGEINCTDEGGMHTLPIDGMSMTPQEVNFRCRLDSTQCSPIQSVDDSTDQPLHGHSNRSLTETSRTFQSQTPSHALNLKKKGTVEWNHKASSTTSPSMDSSGQLSLELSEQSSATSKTGKLRPMPDMSAFDLGSSTSSFHPDPSFDTEHGNAVAGGTVNNGLNAFSGRGGAPPSPMKYLCPPTPVRTPAWAHNGFSRSNSLIATKVLAAGPITMVEDIPAPEESLEESDDQIENGKLSCGPNPSSLAASFSAVVEEESELDPPNVSFLEGRSGLFDIVDDEDVDMSEIHMDGTQEPKSKRRNSTNSVSASFKSISVEGTEAETTVSEGVSFTANTPFKTARLFRPREHSFGGASAGEVGTVISFESQFQSLGRLGSGAFADVFKVRCNVDGNFYAVKRTRRQFRGKRDRERAMTEVRIMQRLQSNSGQDQVVNYTSFGMYILSFIRAWQEDGHLFSQTELCCRHTCRQLLLSLTSNWDQALKIYPSLKSNMILLDMHNHGVSGTLVPERTVWKICHDVAAGLCHIHSHGIVHHDIKPENIFFVLHPQLGALCKIGDFGMAGDSGTVEDGQEGDTVYMPQELFNSPTKDPRGDIFSFGLSLYEVASTGTWTLPTEGVRWHEIRSGAHEPELPSSRSKDLVNLIQKMINPIKEKRPTAHGILSSGEMVAKTGKASEKFLTEYINDIDNYDQAREREAVIAQYESNQR